MWVRPADLDARRSPALARAARSRSPRAASSLQPAHGLVEGDRYRRQQDHAGEQLRHLEVLAPVGDQVADAGARGVHLGDHHAGEIEDHRDAQRLEQERHHARHVDARQDLRARGAVGARHQHMVGLDRFDRGRRAHDDDEDGRECRVGDLLLKADAEHQDEHRQEDRFRHAEHVEQHRLEDLRRNSRSPPPARRSRRRAARR